MSAPRKYANCNINNGICEIISGISSLNMPAMPIPKEEVEKDSNRFISETDYMVKHAVEHFHAAIEILREAQKREMVLEEKILRLECKLLEKGVK